MSDQFEINAVGTVRSSRSAPEDDSWDEETSRIEMVAPFDGFKKHCSYFPHGGSVLKELDGFPEWCEVSKGTLKFPIGKKLPKNLVRKLISVRSRQIIEKQKGSSSVKLKK